MELADTIGVIELESIEHAINRLEARIALLIARAIEAKMALAIGGKDGKNKELAKQIHRVMAAQTQEGLDYGRS